MDFDLSNYQEQDYDLFHVKYGRGATILAIAKARRDELFKTAALFHSKGQDPVHGYIPKKISPIIELEEMESIVRLTIDYSGETNKTITPQRIKRVLTKSQISFEVFE